MLHFLDGLSIYGCEVDLSTAKSEEEAARLVKEFYDNNQDKDEDKDER